MPSSTASLVPYVCWYHRGRAVLQGYIVRISGGNDKQGFPMKQGVLTNGRVRLLLSKGHSCYRPRRNGERRRKSVRGCIVDANLSVLNLVIIKKGQWYTELNYILLPHLVKVNAQHIHGNKPSQLCGCISAMWFSIGNASLKDLRSYFIVCHTAKTVVVCLYGKIILIIICVIVSLNMNTLYMQL